jgi:diadenylate cyclase
VQYHERLQELITRIEGYDLHVILAELAILWVVVYLVVRFLRGTRGARAIKTIALVLIVLTPLMKLVFAEGRLDRLNFLYGHFLTIVAIALVVVFQPELRRALIRVGEARLFRRKGLRKARVIEDIVGAVVYLSRTKTGALIAIEGQVACDSVIEAGTKLDALVSQELLNTIFWPGSALHDMAVVVRDNRVVAAGAQLPLAEGQDFGSELGSRHRAAIGLSLETDAMIVVVSEETGIISLAHRGQLFRNLTADDLRALLAKGLGPTGLRAESTKKKAA